MYTRSFERFQLFVNRARNFKDHIERRAVGGIEIEENIIRMILVIKAAGPRIVIDASKIRQVEQVRADRRP